jgi:diguanylate cyclase (GGDEF)-like protein
VQIRRRVDRRLDTNRPPNLVVRFAVITALCLAVGGATILAFTRHLDLEQAEKHAAQGAQVYATGLLSRDLRADDVRERVSGARRAELDRLLETQMQTDGTLRVALTRSDGLITYSTDHQEIGQPAVELDRIVEALSGTITSRTESIVDPQTGARTKVLRSFVPITLGESERGVARIDLDYGPIAAAAREAFLPVAGILEGVLLVLYVLMLPVLIRASRRIRRQMEHIQQQANYDDLTGLPNRRLFLERLDATLAEADGRSVAVLMLDVDRFGHINDTLGHQCGDRFLQELAGRLADRANGEIVVARIGGDEFGITLPDATARDATAFAALLRSDLVDPILVDEIPLDADLSVGIAAYPGDGQDATTLVRRADVALRLAEESHTSIRVYEEGQDTIDREQLALLPELRGALTERELVIHYQLKADLRTGAINGAEALVRWQHPERGLLPPGAFIPYAEATGLGRDLSRYVVEVVSDDLAVLCELGLRIPIAVNLSALDLLDTSLPRDVMTLLQAKAIDPQLLELEITETAVMTDHARARAVLGELGELGTRLAIDDFGTGYSSLSYLTSLPIDTIKIDMSFVRGMLDSASDAAIVHSVIQLGHSLGLNVVAEGVETRELWDALKTLDCDTAQGFYFAEPRPLDDLMARLLSTQAVPEPRRDNVLKAQFGADPVPAA